MWVDARGAGRGAHSWVLWGLCVSSALLWPWPCCLQPVAGKKNGIFLPFSGFSGSCTSLQKQEKKKSTFWPWECFNPSWGSFQSFFITLSGLGLAPGWTPVREGMLGLWLLHPINEKLWIWLIPILLQWDSSSLQGLILGVPPPQNF